MRRRGKAVHYNYKLIPVLSFALIILIVLFKKPIPICEAASPVVLTNHKFIDGLNINSIHLGDDKAVFRYVFFSLEDEVFIYPSENYFYFRFPMQGKVIWGSMSLFATERDEGVIGFGYSEHNEDSNIQDVFDRAGGGGSYSEKDGVIVKKITDWRYQVMFEGKTVTFILNKLPFEQPKKAKLHNSETFVGPTMDESGLKFYVLFNEEVPHLYFVLNEDSSVPETFQSYTSDIVIGERTRFAFYLDKELNRKILIGVKGENVLKNNWYDGPFDQMPDNHVKTGKIPKYQEYLEASYPGTAGRIDAYGNYINDPGTRIAVAPYLIYWSKEDLLFIDDCEASTNTKAGFYNCITEQVFDVPPEKYGLG